MVFLLNLGTKLGLEKGRPLAINVSAPKNRASLSVALKSVQMWQCFYRVLQIVFFPSFFSAHSHTTLQRLQKQPAPRSTSPWWTPSKSCGDVTPQDHGGLVPTSSSESPTGRSRARARPMALECRSVSPASRASESGQRHPVSHRGSLRSVLEDVDVDELPTSPTSPGPPVRTSHTLPGAGRARVRALSALSSDLSLKSDNLGLERVWT